MEKDVYIYIWDLNAFFDMFHVFSEPHLNFHTPDHYWESENISLTTIDDVIFGKISETPDTTGNPRVHSLPTPEGVIFGKKYPLDFEKFRPFAYI